MIISEYEKAMRKFDELSVELYNKKYKNLSETVKTKIRNEYKKRYILEK